MVSQYAYRRMFGTLLVRCDGPMISKLFCLSFLSDSTVCLNHIVQGRPICLFPLDFNLLAPDFYISILAHTVCKM
jgi:predicted metalloenzyme YecM